MLVDNSLLEEGVSELLLYDELLTLLKVSLFSVGAIWLTFEVTSLGIWEFNICVAGAALLKREPFVASCLAPKHKRRMN